MDRRYSALRHFAIVIVVPTAFATPAIAQRSSENAVTSADDAFGTSVGNESIGLYNMYEVRGFSPATAGNIRVDGLYLGGILIENPRLQAGSNVRVGLSAQGYPFPAPTGIVESSLRSAGDDPSLSAVLYGGQDQVGYDLDGQLPLTRDISLAAGFSVNRYIDFPGGDHATFIEFGFVPSWRPREGTELHAFYGLQLDPLNRSTPIIYVDGDSPPPKIPDTYLGQKWATRNARFETMGLFGHTTLGDWRLSGGLFRHFIDNKRSFNTLFVNTAEDGSADYVVNFNPQRTTASNAGELRLSRQFHEGPRHHVLHVSAKGRTRAGDFGGEAVVNFGTVTVGDVPPQFEEPEVDFGEVTGDRIREITAGFAYHGRWQGVGEVSAGIQKTNYRKSVEPPGDEAIVTRAQPWLWNGTVAANIAKGLVAYAGYTKGLEDSGVAPEIAVNRNEAPPALLTSQRDIGLRYAFGPMRLVVGGFDVRKPYFNLGPDLVYAQLGTVRHRGLEISLAGQPIKGLNIVAGAVLMKPRVVGKAVDLELVGRRPVGQAARSATLYLDYRLPRFPSLSLNLGVQHLGKRPGSVDNELTVPGRTLVNAGARYRFELGRMPATLRIQVSNLFDTYAWNVTGGGGFRRVPPRRANASLSVDF